MLAFVLLAACGVDVASAPEPVGTTVQALRPGNYVGASLPSKALALTFDDGPGARTAELSTYLRGKGIRAAFFVNGGRLAPTSLPNPSGLGPVPTPTQGLAQLSADGHLIANHTTTHRDLVTQVRAHHPAQLPQELAETDQIIAPFIPSGRLLFRPPFGSWSPSVAQDLAATPMKKYLGPVNWDIGGISTEYPARAADWACFRGELRTSAGALAHGTGYATSKQCADAYLAEIRTIGRGIVLMHDPYGWSGGDTVDMVMYMVPVLQAEGFSFVRADEVPAINAELPPIACDASCTACFGTPSDQCTACAPGRLLKDTSCVPCTQCVAGQYAAAACAGSNDTWCVACDKSCATCKGKGPTACTGCPPGAFLKGGRCTPCRTCGEGESVRAACTQSHDTVCDVCPESDAAATCITCGDCDDEDPCTDDACSEAGCVHVAIAACGAAPAVAPQPTEAAVTSVGAGCAVTFGSKAPWPWAPLLMFGVAGALRRRRARMA
jgi:peptidoglycan/xylan/chitin deacetylase (PgdA/CDA1 family)